MNLSRRLNFSVSLRAIVFGVIAVVLVGCAVGVLEWSHARQLSAQKAEYRRRLRFLRASNEVGTAAGGIMSSYQMGDSAFGIAREKALTGQEKLQGLAVTVTEHQLSQIESQLIDLYSNPRCRSSIVSCEAELDAATLAESRTVDELLKEAKAYDWRPASDQADDDPLQGDDHPSN